MDSSSAGSANSSDFVRKLYKMLENPSDESVVRWGNEGDSFVVLENEKFTKHILPKHFKHSNFASFVRQLNKYDFHKVRHNNEDGAGSPYGPGAWEFKHPDFKMNNKDALDNIRRKAPAPRKSAANPDELLMPTQQVDMLNSQLQAVQHQFAQLQEKNIELTLNNNIMAQDIINLQKTVLNHEHILQNVVNFLNDFDAKRRRDSRTMFTTGPTSSAAAEIAAATTTSLSSAQDQLHTTTFDDDTPPSPLLHAAKLLSETNVDVLFNRGMEHMNEIAMRTNGVVMHSPGPDFGNGRSTTSGPPSAGSSGHARFADLDNLVYPVGQTNGIDPMYGDHIHNIPYSLPSKQEAPPQLQMPKKAEIMDPGWMKQPQILLVEDDPTCRKIGNKLLQGFNCQVTMAHDGHQAVEKVREGKNFDLILMDIIMPNLDGISATHFIRAVSSAVPIIAMTSNIRSDDLIMYYTHGMNDILPKPFTRESLLHLLEKYLLHLKKPDAPAITTHPHSLGGPTVPTGVPRLKEESAHETSPQKSSATLGGPASAGAGPGAWHSPQSVQMSHHSAASLSPDGMDFSAGAGAAPMFGGGGPPSAGIPTTPTALHHSSYGTSVGGAGAGQRRGIGDISGGEGPVAQAAKRHQAAQHAAAQQQAAQQQQQMYGMGMPAMGRR